MWVGSRDREGVVPLYTADSAGGRLQEGLSDGLLRRHRPPVRPGRGGLSLTQRRAHRVEPSIIFGALDGRARDAELLAQRGGGAQQPCGALLLSPNECQLR